MNFVNWTFNQRPSSEQIYELLKNIPAWSSPDAKPMSDYAEYVVPMKAYNKEARSEEWRLYVMVSGKCKILADAHTVDGKRIPTEETMEVKFVGNFVICIGSLTSPIFGKVFDVGTGLTEGGKGADASNPIENASTSLRGRMISALCGAGIIPFSGMASVEEMITLDARNELAEAGMKVINTTVNPKVETPNELPNSPAQEQDVTGKTKGGLAVETAQKIVSAIKNECESEDKFLELANAFLNENEMSCPDPSALEAAVLSLDPRLLGKLRTFVVKAKK